MSGPALPRMVADLGNSRLKWGQVDARGRVVEVIALVVEDEARWDDAWNHGHGGDASASWAIASVNPPAAERLAEFLARRAIKPTRWYRSAAEVPLRHGLEHPETAGADRALAVVGARADNKGAGAVVTCGTAVTVERIAPDGTWQGGAIAAGMELTARALHLLTAQLPLVVPREAPPAWGSATLPAVEAGIYWGVVGAVRELLTRQTDGLNPGPWVVWTGGAAPMLAKAVDWPGSRVVPDLVLRGLAEVAFGATEG